MYLCKRTIAGVVILLILSALIYSLVRFMPADFVKTSIAGNASFEKEALQQLTQNYGMDEPAVQGWVQWLINAAQGRFGISFLYKKPVSQVLLSGLGITLFISATALIFQLLFAMFLGIKGAMEDKRIWRSAISAFTILSISMPVFFIALLLQKWFALDWTILPLQGQVTLKAQYVGISHYLDMGVHLILPIMTLVFAGAGGTARVIRERTEEILSSDYVLYARMRGYDRKDLIKYEILPGLRVILAVIIGREIPGLITKTLIVEQVFALHGIGTIVFAALRVGDIPLIMGFSMWVCLVIVVCSILEDVAYASADPRIRIGKGTQSFD